MLYVLGRLDRLGCGLGQRLPLDPVQEAALGGAAQPLQLKGLGAERGDGEEGRAGVVEDRDGALLPCAEAQAQGRLLGSVQGDLGVELLAVLPGRAHTREAAPSRPVLGEALVEIFDLERLSSLGRPGAEGLGDRCGLCGEGAACVSHPLRLLFVETGVDRDLSPALLIGTGDRDLASPHRSPLGDDQGRLQIELLDAPGAHTPGALQGQVEQGGGGQERRGGEGVVGKPGLGGAGETAGEQEALAPVSGQSDRRPERGRQASVCPIAVASRDPLEPASSQKRSRWKG